MKVEFVAITILLICSCSSKKDTSINHEKVFYINAFSLFELISDSTYNKYEGELDLSDFDFKTSNPNSVVPKKWRIVSSGRWQIKNGLIYLEDWPEKANWFGDKFCYNDIESGKLNICFTKVPSLPYDNTDEINSYDNVYDKLGLKSFREKDLKQAISLFNESTKLHPDNLTGYFWQAECYTALNDFPSAIKSSSIVITKLKKQNETEFNKTSFVQLVYSYLVRGHCKLQLNEIEGAISDFSMVIEMDTLKNYDNLPIEFKSLKAAAYHKRGLCNFERLDHSNAIKDYDNAIKIDPNQAIYYHDRAFSKSKLDKYYEAIEDYYKAISLYPQNTSTLINLAFCKYKMGDLRGAMLDLDKSIEIDSTLNRAYYHRGNVKFDLNDKEGACSDWNKASQLGDIDATMQSKRKCM